MSSHTTRRISLHTLRPTHVHIDLAQIVHNYRAIEKHCNRPVMAVIKADAYGHGIVEVAKRLQQEGAPYFGVAYLEEALLLREEGISTPILVMGGILGEQVPLYIENEITLTASSVSKLQSIERVSNALGRRAKVHLKIDTGMGRIGIQDFSAHTLLEEVKRCQCVDVEGIFTHFANADAQDLSHAKLQCVRFERVLALANEMGLTFSYVHMANSGAVLQLPESYENATMVRPGILLYGVYPSTVVQRSIPVKPAMRWESKVVYFKVIPAGRSVGYGSRWTPCQATRVVTIPVGYGDGYHRRMMGRAEVLIRGKRYPVVGSICMDQIMVDIGQDEAFNGDEVLLLGKQGDGEIHIEELAAWAETIPYEILTSINLRVSREYCGINQQ